VSDVTWNWQEQLVLSDEGQVCADGPSADDVLPTTEVNDSRVTQSSAVTSHFQGLFANSTNKGAIAEQGLDLLDRVLKSYVDGVAQGSHRPHFIHHLNWDRDCRPLVLIEAAAVAQLYATVTLQADAVLLRSIDTQLISLQRNVGFDTPGCKVEANSEGQLPTQKRADDVSMMQAVLLYAMMHIYRAGPTASQCIDRVPLRLMQVSSSISRSHFHKQVV
jgi:hypothetical protein